MFSLKGWTRKKSCPHRK